MEGHADDIHAVGLKRLFREHGEANPTRFLIARELFRHLERVTDAFEDVANEIDGLVIDHAYAEGVLMYELAFPLLVGLRTEEHKSELPSLMRISYAVFCLKNNH